MSRSACTASCLLFVFASVPGLAGPRTALSSPAALAGTGATQSLEAYLASPVSRPLQTAAADGPQETAPKDAAPKSGGKAPLEITVTPAKKSQASKKPDAADAGEPEPTGPQETDGKPKTKDSKRGDAAAKSNPGKTAAKPGQSDDLLIDLDTLPPGVRAQLAGHKEGKNDDDAGTLTTSEAHLQLFTEGRYPSAATCGVCHPKHYKEWSVSQHSYSQLSPIYMSLNNKINQLTNGSDGDFCFRCHSPVGANLGEDTSISNLDRHPASREGITCVVCHRIDKAYNKVSGRLALVEGGLTEPVFGPEGNRGVAQVLKQPDKFRVVTDPRQPGRKIHNKAKAFAPIKTSTFCGSCHDVTLFNGFRLEEAFSEYRLSPAAAKGITCQDCHMGKIQGKVSGYEHGPAAVVGGVPTRDRKLTSHLFSGPDYPVIHPGIFPHNEKAQALKTMREWLTFDDKAGWGTDTFEKHVAKGYRFPKAWTSVDDRYDARQILDRQSELLEFARRKRRELLKNGFVLGDVVTERPDAGGIAFRVQIRNGTNGHNVPTGFTGERPVWLDVTVKDRDGRVVFRSGDRDPNGDLRDGHSAYVHAGKVPLDPYLMSLQSIFVTQNGRGGEIERVIPIPFPSTALPRVLPSTSSLVFTGEPPTERSQKKGIEPDGERWAHYDIAPRQLTGRGPYKATIKLNAQAVPVNLLVAIQGVGFDYNMSPAQIGKALVAGTQTLWEKHLTFRAGGNAPLAPPRRPAPDRAGVARP